jgi:hypothetical protein
MLEEQKQEHRHEHHHPVEITIDRKHLSSPNPTTGAALYTLGQVPADYTLFEETPGPEEDKPIPNDHTVIHLHKHEKFYSSPGKVTPGGTYE